MNGISIGGRKFYLLGASTSQLRDHGMVLVVENEDKTNVASIRAKIGEGLEKIQNPAKYIARIGQAMSSSQGYLNDIDSFETIKDITHPEMGAIHPETHKAYVFSDGVGMVGIGLAKRMANAGKNRSTSEENSMNSGHFQYN
jgi:hypothetical protein